LDLIANIILDNWKNYQRHFFWRNTADPYEIMIAEFMLQRTKANQVESIYKNFLKQYPNVEKLAKARFSSVSKYTSSLGLHKRSSCFIDAAKFIVYYFNGIYPKTRNELLLIPGIGDYVAGAILAVCYNKPEYVIDSNIARFINRFYDLRLTGEIRRKKIIIEKARELFNYYNSRKFLFSILDFTALICKPRNPDCDSCILEDNCIYERKQIN